MKKTFWLPIVTSLLGVAFIAGATSLAYRTLLVQELSEEDKKSKEWSGLSKEELEHLEAKIKPKIVKVTAGNSRGSGCEVGPKIFLTARHVLADAILDNINYETGKLTTKQDYRVNDKPARLIFCSPTNPDYCFLTTNPRTKKVKFDPKKELTIYEDIIISGDPGEEKQLVQPGKIMNVKENSPDDKSSLISGQYIDFGISGGCVFTKDGIVVGIVRQKNNQSQSTVGVMSYVKGNVK